MEKRDDELEFCVRVVVSMMFKLDLRVLTPALLAIAGCVARADAPASDAARLHALAAESPDWSNATLDRLKQGLNADALRRAARVDPIRHASLEGRPMGWAAFNLSTLPSLGFHDLSQDDARRINALIPAAHVDNPPAKPFVFRGSAADRARAEHCLAQAVYYEAGYETAEGEAAVAQTVLNRVRHPGYPRSVCGVVFQGSQLKTGCQFSFTCDGSMNRALSPAAWTRALDVARRALNGYVMKAIGAATHYHAAYVAPYWAPSLVKTTQIGAHIFYRWSGPGGEPAAFTQRYGGDEGRLDAAVLLAQGPLILGRTTTASTAAPPPILDESRPGEVRTFAVVDPPTAGDVHPVQDDAAPIQPLAQNTAAPPLADAAAGKPDDPPVANRPKPRP